jgi:D-3-phosphoglycerate dehydrogenase
VAADQAVKGGAWDVVAHKGIQRLRGQTLGLLGFGKIARALAAKAQALGMRVIAVDPFVDAETMARLKARAVDMDALLAESDAVSVHVPLSPETRGIIGERALARMKPTAFLINTSRGGLVDEDALAAALTAGRLAGAALDVVEKEPPPPDHPLRKAPNLIMTPHLAFYSREAVVELQTKVAEEAARAFRGEPPRSPVNREVLAGRCP